MKNEYRQILSKMFGGEIPGFITEAGQNFLKIRLQGEGIRTVRLQDVLEFLEQKPGDGMKMFAGVLFDSKQAYFLAIMFHEYFKAVQMGG
jgi:hypothetical protein